MDQATASDAPTAAIRDSGAAPAPRDASSRQLRRDLVLLGLIGVLLAAAIWAGFASLHRQFWGPSAFVERYIGMLADGDAASALAVPGVTLDSADLEAAQLPGTSSDALLRSAALTFDLTDVEIAEEREVDGAVEVTASYRVDGTAGESTFRVVRDGTEGLVPRWAFESSPLAAIQVTVRGSMQFSVNDFEIDKRQVSPDGAAADPLDPVSLLVFSPGLYSVGVDTAVAEADETHVLADAGLHSVPLDIQAQPTQAFADVVQDKVESFLASCAEQQVLQPTGCPFGLMPADRLWDSLPQWSIVREPDIQIVPQGAYWGIAPATGTAHLEAQMVQISNGVVYQLSEDVPFVIDGTVDILPDGTASILVGSPALR
ncbi:hypothetical protein [Microbacterium sp. NPDC096154]|uniref:hypothetical protein n=1 Tax=Microbacterium sp. NPDC096154 TaxID=3155549 RepID=UPI00332541EF